MLPIEPWMAFAIVAVGALVQGAVGFGSSLVAAPLLVLIDPVYVPGPMIVAAFVLTTLIALREKRELSLRAVGWAIVGELRFDSVSYTVLSAGPGGCLNGLHRVRGQREHSKL